MNIRSRKLLIVAALAVAVTAVIAQRERRDVPIAAPLASNRPRLVDVGAESCVPCKMMVPVLADLRRDYAGALDVVFIDVWKNPDAGTPYNVDIIPTQIFFDATGREIYRHVGFFAKDDILAAWKQLGVELKPTVVVPTL